jgi:hypothetical protein
MSRETDTSAAQVDCQEAKGATRKDSRTARQPWSAVTVSREVWDSDECILIVETRKSMATYLESHGSRLEQSRSRRLTLAPNQKQNTGITPQVSARVESTTALPRKTSYSSFVVKTLQ